MNLSLYSLFLQVLFDNRAHSGKIMVDVKNDVRIYECRDWKVEGTCKFYPKVVFIFIMDKLGGWVGGDVLNNYSSAVELTSPALCCWLSLKA